MTGGGRGGRSSCGGPWRGRGVRRPRRQGKTDENESQPAISKIFRFTEIRFCRMCRPSQPTKGAVVRRHERGLGLRWTRAALKAGLRVQGEMKLVSAPPTAIDGRRPSPAKPLGEAGLPAYGETVWSWPSLLRSSLCEGVTRVNRRGAVNFAGARETRRNSAPGRARHRPSNHRAGKAWFRLPCGSPVHRVCNQFAWGFLWVPAGTRSSLRPFFSRGEARSIARANLPRDCERVSATRM